MSTPTMLYKKGAKLKVDGEFYDYIIVEAESEEGESSELDKALADGWFKTPFEALNETANDPGSPWIGDLPSREELEAQATELGIKFSSRTSDEKLAEKILAEV